MQLTRPHRFRSSLRWMQRLAGLLSIAGGAALLVGAIALPWARFRLLGVEIVLPGAAFLAGGAAAALGLASLTGFARRWPLVSVLLGLIALGLGATARREVGRSILTRQLAVSNALAPVNARLAQVDLPPIEPFGAALLPWRDYAGPGPLWVMWGGAAAAIGGAVRFAAGRSLRTCLRCGTLWRPGREIAFCPRCGTENGTDASPACPRCWLASEPEDRFCARCGTSLSPGSARAPAPGMPPEPPRPPAASGSS